MILGKKTIIEEVASKKIIIEPFDPEMVGPNSVDLHLGGQFKRVLCNLGNTIHPKHDQVYTAFELGSDDEYLMLPGELILATTQEICGSAHYVPMIEGRSSIGRMGLFIHVTAGVGDLGFVGRWTLELTCIKPFWIFPGMRICQVIYHTISDKSFQYDGRYQGQTEPVESRYNK